MQDYEGNKPYLKHDYIHEEAIEGSQRRTRGWLVWILDVSLVFSPLTQCTSDPLTLYFKPTGTKRRIKTFEPCFLLSLRTVLRRDCKLLRRPITQEGLDSAGSDISQGKDSSTVPSLLLHKKGKPLNKLHLRS